MNAFYVFAILCFASDVVASLSPLAAKLNEIHMQLSEATTSDDLETLFASLDEIEFKPGSEFDEDALKEIETLVGKVQKHIEL